MKLYDINLLLGLWYPNFSTTVAARAWHRATAPHPWATCEHTWSGFIRLSMNPAVIGSTFTARQAFQLLETNTRSADHRFLDFKPGETRLFEEIMRRCQGHRQITDAFLLHIAITHGAVFTTFDQRMKHISPDPSAVEVIPLF